MDTPFPLSSLTYVDLTGLLPGLAGTVLPALLALLGLALLLDAWRLHGNARTEGGR